MGNIGSRFVNRPRYGYSEFFRQDTATLISHDVISNPTARPDDVILELDESRQLQNSLLHDSRPVPLENLRSPSECTTISTLSCLTSPADKRHQYDLYFVHHPDDTSWLESLVARLEAEPLNYVCIFSRDFINAKPQQTFLTQANFVQNIVILILSKQFIKETWCYYEPSLQQFLAASGETGRIITVLLEDCDVPHLLAPWTPLDISKEEFWEKLCSCINMEQKKQRDVSRSDSVQTFSSPSSGFHNGQAIAELSNTIQGTCTARLEFDDEEVPDTLAAFDVAFTRQDYSDIVNGISGTEGSRLPWVFSVLPNVLLGFVFIAWCLAFILVILLLPDNTSSTLPVRLCIFTLPALCIVLGCLLRWRKLNLHKDLFSTRMFSRSIRMNMYLSNKMKPVIVTTAKTGNDTFHIYFVYYNTVQCVEHVERSLRKCSEGDITKLLKLINVYTLSCPYMEEKTLGSRLTAMMSSAYAVNLLYKRIPHSLEQRHTRRRQCLCQFVEDFLASYLPSVREEADILNLKFIFSRYLNCRLQPNQFVLNSLGINIIDI